MNRIKADISSEVGTYLQEQRVIMSPENTGKIVDIVFDFIREEMLKGNTVSLRGFGTFSFKKRKAKTVQNISKNESIRMDEHCRPSLKFAPKFVNEVKATIVEEVIKEQGTKLSKKYYHADKKKIKEAKDGLPY